MMMFCNRDALPPLLKEWKKRCRDREKELTEFDILSASNKHVENGRPWRGIKCHLTKDRQEFLI